MRYILGPCLFNDLANRNNVLDTAIKIKQLTYRHMSDKFEFRIKLWGGGTTLEKCQWGVGTGARDTLLELISITALPVWTEVQTPTQAEQALSMGITGLWIGARNSSNYGLIKDVLSLHAGNMAIKRGPVMTVEETIGILDIATSMATGTQQISIIERGCATPTRSNECRFVPDLLGVLRMRSICPNIDVWFDPSHSTMDSQYIFPIMNAAHSIGISTYMIEVYNNTEWTATDKAQAIAVDDLDAYITGYDYI